MLCLCKTSTEPSPWKVQQYGTETATDPSNNKASRPPPAARQTEFAWPPLMRTSISQTKAREPPNNCAHALTAAACPVKKRHPKYQCVAHCAVVPVQCECPGQGIVKAEGYIEHHRASNLTKPPSATVVAAESSLFRAPTIHTPRCFHCRTWCVRISAKTKKGNAILG